MPPFTQHADAPQRDTAGHGHHAEPVYEKVTGFQPSVDVPDLPEEDEKQLIETWLADKAQRRWSCCCRSAA